MPNLAFIKVRFVVQEEMPFVFKIGFFLALSTVCLSCPLRTLIRKRTRLVPLKVRKVYFTDPDKPSPIPAHPLNGPANNLSGYSGAGGKTGDYAKLPGAITNGPLPAALRNSQPNHHHHLHQQQHQQQHQQLMQKVLLDAALVQQQPNSDANKQPILNTNIHTTAAASSPGSLLDGGGWPAGVPPSSSHFFPSKLTPKEALPPAGSPLAFPPGVGGGAKYVLLSPMYGSRSLLLSPVLEAKDCGGGGKQQQQSGFIILPVETLSHSSPPPGWAKEQTRFLLVWFGGEGRREGGV
jgi:hypothetical protein